MSDKCCFFFFFLRRNSSLVCLVGITYVYIDMVFGFMGTSFICFFPPSLLLGCLSMTVWASAVLGVLHACVLYLHLFSAIEHVSHGKVL